MAFPVRATGIGLAGKVNALGMLRPYFASCHLLATYHAPDQVQNDWTNIQIAVCTRPAASWPVLWPHLKHYG